MGPCIGFKKPVRAHPNLTQRIGNMRVSTLDRSGQRQHDRLVRADL